jgi:hypothetical protein
MEKNDFVPYSKTTPNKCYQNTFETTCDYSGDNEEKSQNKVEEKSQDNFGEIESSSTICKEFFCNKCEYYTKKNSDFIKHLKTKKHNNRMNEDDKTICDICNRQYSSASNLWKHKQKCRAKEQSVKKKESIAKPEKFTNDMILELIKQNKELQTTLIEQSAAIMEQNTKLVEMTSKGQTNINTTNSNNTTNNNQFNINLFLNEQCKNAVNIVDFLNSLQVQIQDLEKTGKLGYVEGISSIFLKGLRELNVYQRPIHCTDLKRETVYVKDNDTWEKDNSDKSKLKNVIKHIAKKNLKTLPKWQQENPDFITLDTKENNDYLKIALNSLGGQNEEEDEKFAGKIIRNVLKDVVIDKNEIAR